MKLKNTSLPQLTEADIKRGHCYSSKKPKRVFVGFSEYWDDKQVLYISPTKSHAEVTFIDYSPEYKEWVSQYSSRMLSSEYDQSEFESKHENKEAKICTTEWDYNVQYDSPSLKNGKSYPLMPMKKFLAWVGEDVTDKMPSGTWRDWEREPRKERATVEVK